MIIARGVRSRSALSIAGRQQMLTRYKPRLDVDGCRVTGNVVIK